MRGGSDDLKDMGAQVTVRWGFADGEQRGVQANEQGDANSKRETPRRKGKDTKMQGLERDIEVRECKIMAEGMLSIEVGANSLEQIRAAQEQGGKGDGLGAKGNGCMERQVYKNDSNASGAGGDGGLKME